MKKIVAILLVISMILAFSACNHSEPTKPEDLKDQTSQPEDQTKPEEPETPEIPEKPEENQTSEPETEPDDTPEPNPDLPLALSYQTNRYYGMYDEGMKCYVDYPRIRVNDPEKSALSSALDTLDAALYQKAFEIGQELTALPQSENLYFGEIIQYITRSDENSLSLLYETFVNDGTETPEWNYLSYNFDPQTGAELTLENVFDDPSRLPDMLATRLQETYPGVEFTNLWPVLSSGTSWEENSEESSETEPKFAWTLSYEGVEFYFSPGLIAEQSLGGFHVTVRYVNEPIAISDRFQQIPTAYAELMEHQSGRRLDLDGDSEPENLLLEIPAELENGGWIVKTIDLTVNNEKISINCPENTIRVQAYLVHSSARNYLYAICTDASGLDSLLAIALTGDSAELLQTYEGLGLPVTEQEGAYWVELLTNPSNFTLQTCLIPGGPTQSATYCVDTDGRLKTLK